MSRSGYNDEVYDQWALIKWRGQVASAIRGKRGQAFLRELVDSLDAMPEKKLIRDALIVDGAAFIPPSISDGHVPSVCAIGAVGLKRGVDLRDLDPYNYNDIADIFGIAHQLVQEIEWENDENSWNNETPEDRWARIRAWAVSKLNLLTEKAR